MLEVMIYRERNDVDDAITQFVARRSYRLSRPWYLEDVRVEAPQLNNEDANKPKGFWSSLVEEPTPYIDIEVKKKWRGTKVVIKPSAHQNSPLIGYDLQAFLHDERVYENICPPVCPRCANGVPNPGSYFCGRCGHRLAGDGGSMDRDRTAQRSDVLQPGGMMYEDAPLITPDGLVPAPEGDVLRPPPLVEIDETRDADDEPVAVERDDEKVGPVEIDADVAGESVEETVDVEIGADVVSDDGLNAPIAIERDDEIVKDEAENTVESESVAEPEDKVVDKATLEATPEPKDAVEKIENDQEPNSEGNDDTPLVKAEAESDDDRATAESDEFDEEDQDDDPPYERRMLAED